MSNEAMRAEAAREFSQAADALVDACRKLEMCGMADPPIERLLQAIEAMTHEVHQMHRPEQRFQFEAADEAMPGCRIAAMGRDEQGEARLREATNPAPTKIDVSESSAGDEIGI